MKVNPLAFKRRKAYLIGFSEPVDGQNTINNVDAHIDEAKAGLLQWGFM